MDAKSTAESKQRRRRRVSNSCCKHFEPEAIEKELAEIHEKDPDSIYEYWDVVYDREMRICSSCDYFDYCTLPAGGGKELSQMRAENHGPEVPDGDNGDEKPPKNPEKPEKPGVD